MKLEKARRDLYRKLAKKEGFRSRAAFKLLDLNERYSLLKPNQKVVDFGCAPGGWLQVASKAVGLGGRVLGVDVSLVDKVGDNVTTITGDVGLDSTINAVLDQLQGHADVVLSDISPKVSGVWELDHQRQADLTLRVIDAFPRLLKPGGNAVLKIFEGERVKEINSMLLEVFRVVKLAKPKASRSESSEMYFVCLRFE